MLAPVAAYLSLQFDDPVLGFTSQARATFAMEAPSSSRLTAASFEFRRQCSS
jgi:hypothetical protein